MHLSVSSLSWWYCLHFAVVARCSFGLNQKVEWNVLNIRYWPLFLHKCFVAALCVRVVLCYPILMGWCTKLTKCLWTTVTAKLFCWHQSSKLKHDMFLLYKSLMSFSMQSWCGIENATFSSVWKAAFPCMIFISVENWVRKKIDRQLLFCCSTALPNFREREVCVTVSSGLLKNKSGFSVTPLEI